MHLARNWLNSFATTVLYVLRTSAATQEAWFNEKDMVLGTIESNRIATRSVGHCAIRCLVDVKCQAYQYSVHEKLDCKILHRSSTQDGTTLLSQQHSKLYEKGQCETECKKANTLVLEGSETNSGYLNLSFSLNWNSSDFLVIYQNFDNIETGGFQLQNGTQIVAGKLNNAIQTDLSQSQWVSLGNLSGIACLAIPDTCGSVGGALSVWIKILDCPDNTGIISSFERSQGFQIACSQDALTYATALPTKVTGAMTSYPTEWFHTVLNYLGPDQGVAIYHDAVEKVNGSQIFAHGHSAGPGVVVIGRFFPLTDDLYASLMMDELMFFNRKLILEEIQILYNLYK